MGTVLVTGKVRWVQRDGVRKKTNLKDWYVVVDAGHDANGKRRRHWSRKFETKAAAMRYRNEIAREVGASTWQEPSNERLDSFVTKTWLPAAKPSLRQSTWASYERYLRVHVLPEIGGTQLRDVTPQQLNLLYAKLLASGRRGPRPGGPYRREQFVTCTRSCIGSSATRSGGGWCRGTRRGSRFQGGRTPRVDASRRPGPRRTCARF